MESIQLIGRNLRMSREIVLARVEDMRDHALVFPTPRGGCHTLWILGHLAYIEALVVRTFMLGEPNPLAAWSETYDGACVSSEAADFESFDVVLARCRAERAATITLLDTLVERDLDRSSTKPPDGADDLFGTWRDCLQYVADHWYMHRGQLADARRAAGLERMWY